ncbi:HD family phosphohydrolase [Carnobacterium maltaromaticum]|uniref:HD family phosphohydrolase n=1 Tax=Carnobacterium maltaromaticum TaxID=2751 RepID=UPI00165A38A1|nr:HDIG domain-containing metalloprotein [Carnobacterium maltaromaticum]MBC9787340.1 HDIG domain-containing protein [Carnobacterium maltaromaticum]
MKRAIERIQKKMGKYYIPTLLILFSVVLFLIMFHSVQPRSLDVKLYQVAEETVRANATVEDREKTLESQNLAKENVTPVYRFNSTIATTKISNINFLFATIDEVKSQLAERKKAEAPNATAETSEASSKEKISLIHEKMKNTNDQAEEFITALPDWALVHLVDTESSTLKTIKENVLKLVKEAMENPIRAEALADVKQKAKDQLDYTNLTGNNQRVSVLLIENSIVENDIYDKKATELAKAEAVERVQPALILQGQVIVQEGHIVDSNVMHQLKLLGLLDKKTSYQPMYGLVIMLIAQALVLYFLELTQREKMVQRGKNLTLYAFMMIMGIGVMKGLQLIQDVGADFLAMFYPAALVPLLLTIFLSRRFGIIANAFLAAFSIFIYISDTGTSFSIIITLFYLLSGAMGTMLSRNRVRRKMYISFIWLTIFNILFLFAFIFYLNIQIASQEGIMIIVYGSLSGLLSYLMALLLNPYIEVLFEDNAVMTMNELANPNQELLKELLTRAPGTYHHSLMVANLSANAVGAIGGNSMFARVASYYHDVGKIRHPFFFVENLPVGMDNPHNMLTPEESKEIIFNHVTEGVKILEEAKMPQSIIDICAQHHGTTLMKFFYVKAKEHDDTVKESDFRYPGPKPQTKEAAVINIADSAEAAVRAMSNPTKEKIADFIHNLINGRIIDGQFDECEITLKELKIIEKSICEGLNGTFHSRIEYPSLKKDKATEK